MLSILSWVVEEVERQGCGPRSVYDMMCAWGFAQVPAQKHTLPTEADVITLAFLTDPNTNTFALGTQEDDNNYRTTSVTFRGGGKAANAKDVPYAMRTIFKQLDSDTDPESFCIALLNIHPWQDGNGRTTSIVWNWMNGTIDEPTVMPDWFNVHGDKSIQPAGDNSS